MSAPLISCSWVLSKELFEAFNFNLSSFSLIIEVILLLEKPSIIKRDYVLNDYNVEGGNGWIKLGRED